MYNVVIMCVIGGAVSFILEDEQDVSYVIISIFIVFCTTGTLCLVFVPKVTLDESSSSSTLTARVNNETPRGAEAHASVPTFIL